jgi:hypothetical protein
MPRPSSSPIPHPINTVQQSLHHRPWAHRQTLVSPSHLQVSSSGRRLLRPNSSLETPRRSPLLVVFLQVKQPRRAASATITSASHPTDATSFCQHASDSPTCSTTLPPQHHVTKHATSRPQGAAPWIPLWRTVSYLSAIFSYHKSPTNTPSPALAPPPSRPCSRCSFTPSHSHAMTFPAAPRLRCSARRH